MSIWDVLSRVGDPEGYPEDYLNWYRQEYKPRQGAGSVGLDKAIHIWRALKDGGNGQGDDDEDYVPSWSSLKQKERADADRAAAEAAQARGSIGQVRRWDAAQGGGSVAPEVQIKLWGPENPDWENLRPAMKAATTDFLGGIQNRFGKDKNVWITSGYRSPKVNDDTKGAAADSWHLYGSAVDMNLEDYTPEERAAIEQLARERFKEVLFHDAGTGLHLHIAVPLAPE